MKSASDNIPALYFYVESWITGTQDLTPQQRGIYIQLLSHAQVRNGRGLFNDVVKLSRLCLQCNPDDLINWEQQQKDLYYILKTKFILKKNEEGIDAYFNERQQKEYDIARKKKDQVIQSNEKYNKKRNNNNGIVTMSSDSDIDTDIFITIWNKLTYKRGSKEQASKVFKKVDTNIKPELIIQKYNALCSQAEDPKYIPHFVKWLRDKRWDEELPAEKTEQIGVTAQRNFKDYVSFVKRGQHITMITTDMVSDMLKDNLITQEEHDRW